MTLPPLQPADAALLTRYLLAHEDLHLLLSQPNAPELLPLLSFLAHPDITPWLDHYRAIMAHAHQHAALNALSEVLRETTDPTQRRLAATALLNTRTPRPPRPQHPPHAPHPPRPEAHGSDPWASPARADIPRAPRPSTRASLDASMPHCLDAFRELDPPLESRAPTQSFTSPTAVDQPIATLNQIFGAGDSGDRDTDVDIDRGIDDGIDDELDDDIGAELGTLSNARIAAALEINAEVGAAIEPGHDSDILHLDDISHTGDPISSAALTSARTPINDFDLVPTAPHCTPTHARDAPSG